MNHGLRAAVIVCLLLAGLAALATAASPNGQCPNLEGMYEFIGELQPDSYSIKCRSSGLPRWP